MSEFPSGSCPNCGTAVPEGSKFCPECGARQDARSGETVEAAVPTDDEARVPVNVVTSERRYFGVTPGLIKLSRASRRAREQAAVALESLTVRSAARRQLLALRAEADRLQTERERRLAVLGEAVYRGADSERDEAMAHVREIDAQLAAREAEMTAIAEEATRRIHGSKLQAAPTQAMPAADEETR